MLTYFEQIRWHQQWPTPADQKQNPDFHRSALRGLGSTLVEADTGTGINPQVSGFVAVES
jgi:hypothetical protein